MFSDEVIPNADVLCHRVMNWILCYSNSTLVVAEAHVPHLAVSWMDLAAFVGIGGVFMAVFGALLARNKVVCVNDPRLPESLVHENY